MSVRIADYQETTFTSSGTKNTGTLTWQSGDLIIVIAGTENNVVTVGPPTATGLAFTAIGAALNVSNYCYAHAWQATALAPGAVAITVPTPGTAAFGGSVWAIRDHGGLGADVRAATTPTTLALAKTGSNSIVLGGIFDWSAAAAGQTGTPTINVEREDSLVSGVYSIWIGDWVNQGPQQTVYGIGGSARALAKIFIEVKDKPRKKTTRRRL